MSPLSHITTELKPVVGPDCDILVDASDAKFQEYAKRWSDIDRKTPAAILLPTSEKEIQKIVSKLFLDGTQRHTDTCSGTMGGQIFGTLRHEEWGP